MLKRDAGAKAYLEAIRVVTTKQAGARDVEEPPMFVVSTDLNKMTDLGGCPSGESNDHDVSDQQRRSGNS